MSYEEFVNESVLFFETAQKRCQTRLEIETRPSTILQLKKEIEAFGRLKGFWDQEKTRLVMMKSFLKN